MQSLPSNALLLCLATGVTSFATGYYLKGLLSAREQEHEEKEGEEETTDEGSSEEDFEDDDSDSDGEQYKLVGTSLLCSQPSSWWYAWT